MFILILQTKVMFMSHCRRNWEIKHFVKCQSVVVWFLLALTWCSFLCVSIVGSVLSHLLCGVS